MKIYAIDDKHEEVEKAHETILANNHEIATVGIGLNMVAHHNLPENLHSTSRSASREILLAIKKMKEVGGGIITDMMFFLSWQSGDEPTPPSGLLVVLHAVANGVPVVVCTDATGKEHHEKALHWIFDGYISPAQQLEGVRLPFGWVENKDWDAAVKLLEQLASQVGD